MLFYPKKGVYIVPKVHQATLAIHMGTHYPFRENNNSPTFCSPNNSSADDVAKFDVNPFLAVRSWLHHQVILHQLCSF